MASQPYDGVVVTGYGETGVVKRTERDVVSLLEEAIGLAVARAGLRKGDVDGMALASFTIAPDRPIHLVERLGYDLRWFEALEPGGASGVSAILHAARAIQAGDAEIVVCAAADVLTTETMRERNAGFSGGMRDPNATFARIQRRHMEQYGTTLEQLGKISVVSRFHGSLNPAALLREPLTLEQYLASRVVAEPIRLYDCVHPGAGAAAILVRAGDDGIRIDAGGERHNYTPARSSLRFGWEAMSLDVEALDGVQLYDDYPVMVLIQLEDLGFCPKGEGGAFVERTSLRFDGDLPLNTGGGQLACGQAGSAGGFVAPIEAVRQLHGEAGARQVEGARTMLATGLGMIGAEVPLSTAMIVFRR